MSRVTKKLGGQSAVYMMKQQKALAKEEGYIEEMMSGQKVIKVFCHEEESKEGFKELNEQLFRDSEKANTMGNILMPALGNIGNLMYVFIAVIGGILVFKQVTNISLTGTDLITAGIIISFLSMSRQLSQTIGQVSMQVSMIAMGTAGAGRVFALMDEKPEEDEGYVTLVNAKRNADGELEETEEKTELWAWKHPHTDGTITYTELKGDVRLEHVDFGYVPEKTVLHDVTLYAKPGQKIAFVGATGAGFTYPFTDLFSTAVNDDRFESNQFQECNILDDIFLEFFVQHCTSTVFYNDDLTVETLNISKRLNQNFCFVQILLHILIHFAYLLASVICIDVNISVSQVTSPCCCAFASHLHISNCFYFFL